MAKRNDILREFDNGSECFSQFTERLRSLISEIIASTGIEVHSIAGRTKARSSLARKLTRREVRYANIGDITDICGIRIITYFEDDVDKVASAIESEFDIDADNSVDKRVLLDPDRFGYLSLHYVVSLPSRRSDLLEYRKFQGLKAEIQVRSILQHAWAEIEHDLGYKTAMGVPREIRREFSRLAGMLEIADREFTGIRDRLGQYEVQVIEAIRSNPGKVLIDKASVSAFIAHDATVHNIDSQLGATTGIPVNPVDDEMIEWYASNLQLIGISNLGELREALTSNADLIIRFGKERIAKPPAWHGPVKSLGGAISLNYLIQILGAQSDDPKITSPLFSQMRMGKEESLKFVRELLQRVRQPGGKQSALQRSRVRKMKI